MIERIKIAAVALNLDRIVLALFGWHIMRPRVVPVYVQRSARTPYDYLPDWRR